MTTQQNPSQAQGDDAARPDFLQMDGSQSSDAPENTDSWYGWPHRKVEPVTLLRPMARPNASGLRSWSWKG